MFTLVLCRSGVSELRYICSLQFNILPLRAGSFCFRFRPQGGSGRSSPFGLALRAFACRAYLRGFLDLKSFLAFACLVPSRMYHKFIAFLCCCFRALEPIGPSRASSWLKAFDNWPVSVPGFATQSGLHQFPIQALGALGGRLRPALHLALLLSWHHLSALCPPS